MKRCKGNWEVVLVYMPEMSDVFELSIYNEGTKLTLTQLQEVVDEAMTELVEGQEATMEHITASTSGVTTALAGVVTDQGERQMGVLEGLAGYVLRLETRLTQDAEQRRLETEQHRLDMSAVLNALPALVAAQQERANALPAGQQQRALARVPHKPFELSPSGADRASPQEGTAYTPSPLVPCVLDDRLSIFDNQQRTQPPTEQESPMSEEEEDLMPVAAAAAGAAVAACIAAVADAHHRRYVYRKNRLKMQGAKPADGGPPSPISDPVAVPCDSDDN